MEGRPQLSWGVRPQPTFMRIPLRGTPDDWFAWLVGSDEKLRHDAKLLLGGLTPEDPVPPEPLIARLTDRDPRTVFWAVVGLTCLRPRATAAVSGLAHLATADPAFGTRQAAIGALVRVAPRDPVAKRAILNGLVDDSFWVRAEALRALIQVPELDQGDMEAIRALERDSEAVVRNQVEVTLRNIRLQGSPAA